MYGSNRQGASPFNFGQSVDGLTRRRVSGVPGGLPVYEDVYGGLSGKDEKEIALAPWNYRRDVFNKISPMIGGLLGDGNQQTSFGLVGGQNTPQPALPNSFVFSPDQTQQAVNAARSQGDQAAATQKTQNAGDLAGRGFSLRSPLAMAMNQAADTGARMSNADQEREIRLGHAAQNARQDLGVGNLAQQAWQNWNQSDIARRQQQIESILGNQRNSAQLLSILASLGG